MLFLTLSTIIFLFLTFAGASEESGDLLFFFVFSSFFAVSLVMGYREEDGLEDGVETTVSVVFRSLVVLGKLVKVGLSNNNDRIKNEKEKVQPKGHSP